MTQLQPGDTAPEFTLPTANNGKVSLSELRQQSSTGVIVYFYPKAATPGCTTEACDFRDNLASLAAAGYAVVGVSTDSVADLKAFADSEGLTFPLASDTDHQVAEAYGVWGPREMGGKKFDGVARSTFVINPDGVVSHAQYDVAVEGHVAALRDTLIPA